MTHPVPYPPCPTCQTGVDKFSLSLATGLATLRPCGHDVQALFGAGGVASSVRFVPPPD